MNYLPQDPYISIPKLTSVFRNTSATYKFYWFWAILESIEEGNNNINKKELFARMISLAWYTVNYFHISFGKQDIIQKAIKRIKDLESLDVDSNQKFVLKVLLNSQNTETISILNHFDNNVPHKFLSPWLGSSNSKTQPYELALDDKYDAPYSLYQFSIIIRDNWFKYFTENSGILKTFCYWNLALFVQSRNPNVPNIPNKIHRPIIRGNLNKHKIKFWDLVIEKESIKCIYTSEPIIIGEYVIEHFIPYQFVAHDLMWNLIPAASSFNSMKSDKLPNFEIYFDSFYKLQKKGMEIIQENNPTNRFLEDYLSIFPDLKIERNKFGDHIKSMLYTAHNNGFQYLD